MVNIIRLTMINDSSVFIKRAIRKPSITAMIAPAINFQDSE